MNKIIKLLRDSFPEMILERDGRCEIDMEKLKLELGKGSDFINEGYSLNWLGQSYSRVLRDCPTTTLIKPDHNHNQLKENINSDNVYIEGDNLEVLKHLKNAYTSKIKMIYIDPPYNTGSDGFVYNDSFNFDVETFMRLSGLDKEEAEKVLNYTKSKRNSHSAWLTFMYPRLYIARELLKDDGVIFISIDDNEQAQLKLLCDQIFGEENFISQFIWVNNLKGRQISGIGPSKTYEYILCYGKDIAHIGSFRNKVKMLKSILPDVYSMPNYDVKEDIKGKYIVKNELYNSNSNFNEETRPNLVYNILYNPKTNDVQTTDINDTKTRKDYILIPPKTNNNGIHKYHAWRWSADKVKTQFEDLEFILDDDAVKIYTKVRDYEETNIKDIIFSIAPGTSEIKALFEYLYFEYPKPTKLIKLLLSVIARDDIILDFFSGSSTTADAVMQLNAEDNGNRKFIMVQLPEELDKKNSKEAYEFCTKQLKQEPIIPTIAKERIKRAAKKIKEENKDKEYIEDLDLGFKVYNTIEDDRTDVSQLVLFDVKDGIKTEVDDLDALLTTWMLHDGYDLNTKVEEFMINKYKGYLVEQTLYLLEKGFSTDDLLLLVDKLNDPKTPLINQIILNSSNFANKVLQEFHENVFSKNSKEAKIVVEDR